MKDVPRALREAWERTVAAGDPLVALRGAKELKDALSEFEGALAREALASGETWETIGAALGISRQAAWERLRRAIKAEIDADRARVQAERERLQEKRKKAKSWKTG